MESNRLTKIIVRKLLGEATAEELRLLEQWEGKSEANRELLQKLTSEDFLKKAFGDPNRNLRWQEWKKLEGLTTGKRIRDVRLRWLRAAVAVLIPVLGGLAVWQWQDGSTAEVPAVTQQQIRMGSSKAIVELAGGQQIFLSNDTALSLENQGIRLVNHKDTLNLIGHSSADSVVGKFHMIRIPRGGEYIARLEDGSVVHLNSGSEMKIPVDFGVTRREVWLKGEAFFDVSYDENRVFTVHTNKAEISVLGTEFDIRAYEEEGDVVTTLVEGSVEVYSGTVSNRLKPGFQARVAEKGKIITAKVDVYPYIAWKTGRMVFEDQCLEQIMVELQRWYDFEIFYTHPEIKDMRFTIDIRKYDDISKVLALMEKMNKVSFTQKDRTIVLNNR